MPKEWIVVLCVVGALVVCALWLYLVMKKISDSIFKTDKDPVIRGVNTPEFASYEPFLQQILRRFDETEPWFFKTPHEDISITTFDGLTHHGAIFPAVVPTKKVLLTIPGHNPEYKLSRQGSLAVYNGKAINTNVVTMELRALNQVEGKYMTFGWLERYDMLQWIKLVIERFGEDCEVYVQGVSAGATVAAMTAALPELPPQVKGLILESGFSSMNELMHDAAKTRMGKELSPAFMAFVRLSAKVCLGVDINYMDDRKLFPMIKVPILFIHGCADNQISMEKFNALVADCPNEHYVALFPNSMHGTAAMDDEYGYAQAICDFMHTQNLKAKP